MMRVLQVNKFFWQSGGPERCMLELSGLLRGHGHELLFFAMEHERNLPSDCSRYFVSGINYRDASLGGRLRTGVRTVGKTIYSRESRRKMQWLLSAEAVDIAHLHTISRQISPSILPALKGCGVPVVQTVHNAELVCPAAHCFIESRRERCTRCLGGRYYRAITHRCVQHSAAASAIAAAALYWHRKTRVFEKHVDLFICPSRFLAGRLAAGGIPAAKIRHLPNFLDLRGYEPEYEVGRYGLFVGRLSPEKGVATLLEAAALARHIPLVILGEGWQEGQLRRLAAKLELSHVTFVGYQKGDEWKRLVHQAGFVVLPSECDENSPMVIYEAGALGKPVVAADVGGVGELVEDGDTGLLFAPGSAEQLADRMRQLNESPQLARDMGRRGRRNIEQICDSHYERLMAFYEEAGSGFATIREVSPLPTNLRSAPERGKG